MAKKNLKGSLRTAILEAFANNRRLVIWYDDGGTLEDLVQQAVPKGVELIKFEGSYLAIRAKIEGEKDFERKRLVYVPEKSPEPSWLRDYEIFGGRLDLDLPTLLNQEFGLKLDKESRVILQPLNCKRLARRWPEVLGDVEVPLSSTILKRALLAVAFEQPLKFDVEGTIFMFLKHHDTISKELERSWLSSTFLEVLRDEYGYKPAPSENEVDPKRLASTLLLTELVVSSGGVGGDEFSEVLPPVEKRRFWASLVPDWISHRDLQNSFLNWSKRLESEYDIPSKIKGKRGIENVASFGCVDDALIEEVIARISDEGLKGILKHLQSIKSLVEKRGRLIRPGSWRFVDWGVIGIATNLIKRIQDSLGTLEEKNAVALLENYCRDDGWWRIDQLYRGLAKIGGATSEKVKELFINIPRDQYQEWLRKLGNSFTLSIEKMERWRIDDAVDQRSFWAKFVHPQREKVAVFLIDALRYELQKRLAEGLEKAGIKVKHTTMLASLPSITEVGMSSLLPCDAMSLGVSDGKLKVWLDGEIVLTRNDRKKWLKSKFGDRVAFLELKDLQGNVEEVRKEIAGVQILVVIDREIDRAGSFITEELLGYFDELLSGVKTGVEKALELGYDKVIIATDHGFLYLPMPEKIQTVEGISTDPETFVGRRYAIGGPPQVSGTISVSDKVLEQLSEGSHTIFPIGLALFPMPGPRAVFVHGGISPQECCIGVLECVRKEIAVGQKVGVAVSFPSVISSAILNISLEPVAKKLPPLPRTVVIELLAEGKLLLRSDPVEVHDKKESLILKLPRIPKEIEVKVKDLETQEVLFRRVTQVSLEGYYEKL